MIYCYENINSIWNKPKFDSWVEFNNRAAKLFKKRDKTPAKSKEREHNLKLKSL
jgi:hypothetical protein